MTAKEVALAITSNSTVVNDIELIKSYRKEGIEEALRDAAERARLKIEYQKGFYDSDSFNAGDEFITVDKQYILETPYNLD